MNDSSHKTHDTAVALAWDGRDAPRITAKGENELAEQILALARQYDIPLYEDAQLAKLLSQVELGEEIPRELYVAVAQVIAFAYFIAGRTSVFDEQSA